jgi:chemotaxis protein CheD
MNGNILSSFSDLDNVYLKIGEGGFYHRPTAVQTVLGSCVSVTFHDPATKSGAIFHALLPRVSQFEIPGPQLNPYKYVDTAIELLAKSFHDAGVCLTGLEVKLFGGANHNTSAGLDIGVQNVAEAKAALSRHGIQVAAANTGGPKGRKILFISHTGEVYLKMLNTPVRQ